jgi:hypothetical protein
MYASSVDLPVVGRAKDREYFAQAKIGKHVKPPAARRCAEKGDPQPTGSLTAHRFAEPGPRCASP